MSAKHTFLIGLKSNHEHRNPPAPAGALGHPLGTYLGRHLGELALGYRQRLVTDGVWLQAASGYGRRLVTGWLRTASGYGRRLVTASGNKQRLVTGGVWLQAASGYKQRLATGGV